MSDPKIIALASVNKGGAYQVAVRLRGTVRDIISDLSGGAPHTRASCCS